jgi:hypothetical protein
VAGPNFDPVPRSISKNSCCHPIHFGIRGEGRNHDDTDRFHDRRRSGRTGPRRQPQPARWIFIATSTIYRLRSGLNLSVATSAPKRGLAETLLTPSLPWVFSVLLQLPSTATTVRCGLTRTKVSGLPVGPLVLTLI